MRVKTNKTAPAKPRRRGSSPKNGSARSKRRVVLYAGADPSNQTSLFFLNLFWQLMTAGKERGIEMIPVIDSRPFHLTDQRPPEVTHLLKNSRVDGIVGIMLYPSMIGWMEESGIPYAVLTGASNPNRVNFDFPFVVRNSLARFSELGCKSVGFMVPSEMAVASVLEYIDEIAASFAIEVGYEWMVVARQSQEASARNHFGSLWDLRKRPQGLLIFPDTTARGVVSAIVERQVQVPKDLKLILHRNAESHYTVPFPCDWVENSVVPLTEIIFERLEARWAGKNMPTTLNPFRLIKGY